MFAKFLVFFNTYKLTIIVAIISMFVGIVPGCTIGKMSGYRAGYIRGFAEGKVPGSKKKIFPNLFEHPKVPTEKAESVEVLLNE